MSEHIISEEFKKAFNDARSSQALRKHITDEVAQAILADNSEPLVRLLAITKITKNIADNITDLPSYSYIDLQTLSTLNREFSKVSLSILKTHQQNATPCLLGSILGDNACQNIRDMHGWKITRNETSEKTAVPNSSLEHNRL